MSSSQTLPPPEGPEYVPCACGHIEPEHEPNAGECYSCDCTAYTPAASADEDFLVAVEEALEKNLLPTPGVAVLERTRDAVVGALAPLVAQLRAAAPAAAPSAPADRAAMLSDAERTMLTYALNQAQLRMWATGKFTDEDQAAIVSLRRAADEAQHALPSIHANDVQGFCPACGHPTLYVGEGGHLTCSLMDCPKPGAADELLCRVADEAQQPETQAPVCMCGHPMHQHHEDVCLTECGCCDGRELDNATDLPDRLAAALTARFTELGNPFAAMRYHEQGPDGWPASHSVGPNKVADVLRELLAHDEPAAVSQPGKEA